MNALNRKERIPIQAAGSAGGFRRGGVDTIRGSFSTCPLYLRRPAAPWRQPVCQS